MNAPAEIGADRLSSRNFNQLAHFIESYCGIRMPPIKKTMVETRLRRRVRALGHDSLDDYCTSLFETGGLEDEAIDLINAITTNKTDFFREEAHFRILTERALPDLMTQADRPGLDRPLTVWSAACSIGAEPYSLAMVLDLFKQRNHTFRFQVLATDICTEVLQKAKLAIYPSEMIEPVPQDLRRHYFLRSRDPADGKIRIVPAIRREVHFGRLNLMDEDYGVDEMDIIFCRNILIYFDKDMQQTVLNRLIRKLRTGGYLFVGHSETATGKGLPLTPVATAVFKKI